MKNKDLQKLIERFLSGKASDIEREELEKWYEQSESDEGYLHKLSEMEKRVLENRILNKITQNIPSFEHKGKDLGPHTIGRQIHKTVNTPSFPLAGLKVAAMLVVVMLISYLAFQLVKEDTPKISHATDFGQTLEVALPDGSTVILNGNTSITYESDWEKGSPREVFLEGEAYFIIRQTQDKQKFLVHTSKPFNIEVLGTEFLVSDRKTRTQVVLNSGKIQLNYKEKDANKAVKMNPGELVAFQNDDPTKYILKQVNAEIYSSWKNNKLMLDNTSFREICLVLQENYGFNVVVSEEQLLNLRVSGSIPLTNIDMLLNDISQAFGIRITKKSNTIIVEEF